MDHGYFKVDYKSLSSIDERCPFPVTSETDNGEPIIFDKYMDGDNVVFTTTHQVNDVSHVNHYYPDGTITTVKLVK